MSPEPTPNSRPQRKGLPHGTPPWIRRDAVFFITVCCADRETNQLCLPAVAKTVFESVEFRVNRGDWWVHLLVLMPDHLHALISFPQDREMRKVVSNWKENLAKKAGIRWQRDFFDHRLRSDESYEEKARYIRLNPLRRGLILSPADWKFVWEPRETA
jgi:putative transposase